MIQCGLNQLSHDNESNTLPPSHAGPPKTQCEMTVIQNWDIDITFSEFHTLYSFASHNTKYGSCDLTCQNNERCPRDKTEILLKEAYNTIQSIKIQNTGAVLFEKGGGGLLHLQKASIQVNLRSPRRLT